MIMLVFSIKDVKSLQFNTPFYRSTIAMGERTFSDIINDETTLLYTHPGDFDLYCLGEFDTETGVTRSEIRHISNAYKHKGVKEAIVTQISQPEIKIAEKGENTQ